MGRWTHELMIAWPKTDKFLKEGVKKMVDVTKIMAYESGEQDYEDTISMFQEMIDDGTVWLLQGSYGRMAHALIQSRVCTPEKRLKR